MRVAHPVAEATEKNQIATKPGNFMPYHPFADLLDTYQSLAVLVQVLWIVVPPAFVAGIFGLWLNYRLRSRGVERGGEVIDGPMLGNLELMPEDEVARLRENSLMFPSAPPHRRPFTRRRLG